MTPDRGVRGLLRREPGLLAVLAAAVLVWLAVTLPLAVGERTFFFRDVFAVHLPLKAFGAEQLAEGRIPALDPSRGLGQPFRGNPRAGAFYPGNLLYLVLPFWSAFNLHFALHWLLALVAMIVLARELGTGWAGSVIAGLTYAGCGWTLSALSSHPVVVVTAWWPLAMWGAAQGGKRGLAWGGAACGLALLGGAWPVAALGLVPLGLAAAAGRDGTSAARRGWLRGLRTVAGVVAVGLLVALPQLVATARALPFTLRGAHGVPIEPVGTYGLHPLRWLELVLPLPWGWPGDLGSLGYWSDVTPRVPLVLSLHFGVVALVLAVAALRRRPAWAALAAAGLGLAWLGGLWPQALAMLSAGLFRDPEEFLLWLALAAPLLAGWGADVLLADDRLALRWRRPGLLLAAAAGGLGLLVLLVRAPLAAALRSALAPSQPAATVELQTALAGGAWLLAGLLVGGLVWALRRGRGAAVAALQAATLLQLAPLVMTTDTDPFRRPVEWAGLAPPGTAVVSEPQDGPFGDPPPPYRLDGGSPAVRLALGAEDLAPAPGVLSGWTYPLTSAADGLISPPLAAVLARLPGCSSGQRLAWLQAFGVDLLVGAGPAVEPGLPELAAADRAGVPVVLYRVEGTAPPARWPSRLDTAVSVEGAVEAVSARRHPPAGEAAAVITAPDAVPHRAGGAVKVIEATPDRWVVDVASGGGVAVLRRAYQRLWTARILPAESAFAAPDPALEPEVSLLPADAALVAVVVPPGLHRVELSVSAWPVAVAGLLGLSVLLAALAVGWVGVPRGAGEHR